MKVVMPCYLVNEELVRLTKEAIESFGTVELIVIDNGSPIGGGFLREMADVYVRNTTNVGYAKAVNQGLHLAGEGYVAVANNDIRVSLNWQEVATKVLQKLWTYSCHFRMTDYDVPFVYGKELVYTGKERWCTGSFFVVNNGFQKYYDENYCNSYDDWDFFMSVREDDLTTAYTDQACYQHHHSTTQKLISDREANNQKNREYFKRKWKEYPEDLFARLYPEQMKMSYREGFAIH